MNTALWFSNLLFWSAQVALLVLAAAFLPRLLQIRQPRVLLAYWRTLLGIALLLPAIQPWHRILSFASVEVSPDNAPVRASVTPTSAASHWHLPGLELIVQILGFLILAGIALRFIILALGLLRLRQFRRSSSPISALVDSSVLLEKMLTHVNTRAEFRLSSDVDSPVTFGLVDPVILLPERFPSMDTRFQSAIVCHELLHVRRRDWAHHLLEEMVRAVLWFHPAIAWLIARVRLAREQVVDLEVVRLTNARKTYLEALLEFTVGRARIAPVPAPPFLVERQLAERIALMLKEIRMSRTRLIVSLTAMTGFIALAVVFAVWTFPLKAAPRFPQNPPQKGVDQGVSAGVTGGISGGVTGGVSGGNASALPANGVAGGISGGVRGGISAGPRGSASRDIPTVDKTAIWTDTVKRGPMLRQVRGLGTLAHVENSTNLIAKISLPESLTKEVHANQHAMIATEKGPFAVGHVVNVSREVVNGAVTVDISTDEVPRSFIVGDTAPLQVEAVIDIEKIDDVLHVGRPVHATGNSSFSIFKIAKNGAEAERVTVKLGRVSVNSIEVLDGLKEGDTVILSDMSSYENADRIRLK